MKHLLLIAFMLMGWNAKAQTKYAGDSIQIKIDTFNYIDDIYVDNIVGIEKDGSLKMLGAKCIIHSYSSYNSNHGILYSTWNNHYEIKGALKSVLNNTVGIYSYQEKDGNFHTIDFEFGKEYFKQGKIGNKKIN